ncbi:MAG: hypothetical protein H0X17_18880, partial [Deltaproteobacteria bacterium]|nr:hypothetical protein [Deltaproteobacteria bacterium]
RVSGEPPGAYDHYEEPVEEVQWTVASVTEANVMLAAQLDGCAGTWSRAASHPAAALVGKVAAPALELAARQELLAASADDQHQRDWIEQGGEGDWRDGLDVVTSAYHHELTGEHWVMVQAQRGGGCGEPSVYRMAVYRAGADGSVRRVADLGNAVDEIQELVDLDGDGQPELLMAAGSSSWLLDLTGEQRTSISVPSYDEGCGC